MYTHLQGLSELTWVAVSFAGGVKGAFLVRVPTRRTLELLAVLAVHAWRTDGNTESCEVRVTASSVVTSRYENGLDGSQWTIQVRSTETETKGDMRTKEESMRLKNMEY
jgi:hypothetical protein